MLVSSFHCPVISSSSKRCCKNSKRSSVLVGRTIQNSFFGGADLRSFLETGCETHYMTNLKVNFLFAIKFRKKKVSYRSWTLASKWPSYSPSTRTSLTKFSYYVIVYLNVKKKHSLKSCHAFNMINEIHTPAFFNSQTTLLTVSKRPIFDVYQLNFAIYSKY